MDPDKVIKEAKNISSISGMTQVQFVVLCYQRAYGIKLPETFNGLLNAWKKVTKAQLKTADLVFPNQNSVGIYIGNGQMIKAPTTGEVIKVINLTQLYTARRVINN